MSGVKVSWVESLGVWLERKGQNACAAGKEYIYTPELATVRKER